jgi:NADPH2 dehydrogenase
MRLSAINRLQKKENMSNLFSEITIRDTKIKNRVVMPPMVCFGFSGEDGLVTEKNIQHYAARARGGVGLIIIEATCVTRNGRLSNMQLGLWDDAHIDGFSQIARVCHQYGARVLVQIHHAGLGTPKNVTETPLAPSAYTGQARMGGAIHARELTTDEIQNIQSDFIAAAARAEKAGLDGVELHAAHGYLISQFLSPTINLRQDNYGGSLSNKTRFATEIIYGIREATAKNFIIDCRIGCNEPDLAAGIEIAQALEKAGVDLLHVSSGMTGFSLTNEQAPILTPEGFGYSWIVYGGTEIKKRVSLPVIVVNGIRTPQQAAFLVENHLADFAAIGKGLIIDPEWVEKARQQREVKTCIDCKVCRLFRPGGLCPQTKLAGG